MAALSGILTLGFGEIVRVFFLNFSYTGGASGIGGMAPDTNFAWGASACVVIGLGAWRLRYAHRPSHDRRPR
jgi:ABC-type branched-subunit amino acid transport system permease subunit